VVSAGVVVAVSLAYLGALFLVARWADRRADQGRSVIGSGWVYALSLAVYATSWTYYGSVGRAATGGIGFLPIYLGATLALALWWVVVRRIVRISKRDRITSLSDFVAARYGGSAGLGALVTVVAVVGITPYIALQLKAISTTFDVLSAAAPPTAAAAARNPPLLQDSALWVALLLAAFAIVFGARHLDPSERHEGMVAAVAAESVVKLLALLAVGAWVVFGLFDGFGDVFGRAAERPELAELLTLDAAGGPGTWVWLLVLSALAVLLLPRQWQVAVVENVDERHLRTAGWLLPLYLLLANVFVLPIALAGLLTPATAGADPDTFVLALPLAEGQTALAVLVFVGGLSAATGMVVVETVALSVMVSNSLVLPLLLRGRGPLAHRPSLAGAVLLIRRVTIVAVLLLGLAYFRLAGETQALVAIGLVSFAAVAQFAPALLGGLWWRGATRRGAIAGLSAGFAIWSYTLLLPFLAQSGLVGAGVVEDGPFGVALLRPQALLGLDGLDAISHGMTWSLLLNVGLFVGLSVAGREDPAERARAGAFVDALDDDSAAPALRRGAATVGELRRLLARFLGPGRAAALDGADGDVASPDQTRAVEALLTGAIGATSARVVVASTTREQPLAAREVMEILDETSQVLATSRELERATAQLREANARLTELDRLKDEFVSTVTHELRTPLTSIRAFSEILLDNPELSPQEREGFLRTVVEETARLTRLINDVLDLAKLEAGAADWDVAPVDLREVARVAADAVSQLARARGAALEVDVPDGLPLVLADRDRVAQVLVNLLSNAVKFVEEGSGRVRVSARLDGDAVATTVADNGPGLSAEDAGVVFERFRQGRGSGGARPAGTGLGLPISREIVTALGGSLEVASEPGRGAAFTFRLPLSGPPVATVGEPARAEG
jgi:Na+/proline symporter/nitrogen-specific signal transduction histidine kinase